MTKISLTGCDVGISYFLPRSVGISNAAEMRVGDRFVHSDTAPRIRLVSEVVPVEELEAKGQTLINAMLAIYNDDQILLLVCLEDTDRINRGSYTSCHSLFLIDGFS